MGNRYRKICAAAVLVFAGVMTAVGSESYGGGKSMVFLSAAETDNETLLPSVQKVPLGEEAEKRFLAGTGKTELSGAGRAENGIGNNGSGNNGSRNNGSRNNGSGNNGTGEENGNTFAADSGTESTGKPGWQETSAGWIYRGPDGRMEKGTWLSLNGNYYYLNAAGIMESGEFRKIGSDWYSFAGDGRLNTGRFTLGDNEYCSNAHGVLTENSWFPDADSICYADKRGLILKNTTTPDGYRVDENGHFVRTDPLSSYQVYTYTGGENVKSRGLYLNVGTAQRIWQYLAAKGWTATAIAGLLGNFQQESGISPTLEEAGNHIGYGLGQWSYGRRTTLEHYAASRGVSAGDLYLQLEFLLNEPEEAAYVRQYAATAWRSPSEAAYNWGAKWERYNFSDGSMETVRIPYAEAYYQYFMQ